MAYGEDDEQPPVDPAIFGEVGRLLEIPEGLIKQYWQSLAVLLKLSSKDPILALAVVMGTISLLVAKVPSELAKVLKSLEETKSSHRALGALEHHIRTTSTTCKDATKDVRVFKEQLRLVADSVKHFQEHLKDTRETIDRKVASVNHDFSRMQSVMRWVVAFATMQIIELILLLYHLR